MPPVHRWPIYYPDIEGRQVEDPDVVDSDVEDPDAAGPGAVGKVGTIGKNLEKVNSFVGLNL